MTVVPNSVTVRLKDFIRRYLTLVFRLAIFIIVSVAQIARTTNFVTTVATSVTNRTDYQSFRTVKQIRKPELVLNRVSYNDKNGVLYVGVSVRVAMDVFIGFKTVANL